MSTDPFGESETAPASRASGSITRREPPASGFREGGERRALEIENAIVVLGPPGAGKGTQASLLSERLGIPHISTGDILRDRILLGDEFGRAIARRIDVGRFVPDAWIERMLEERLALSDCRPGVILDGFPRTLPQAERFVERCMAEGGSSPARIFVVRLNATPEVLAARFSGRRQCSECGALFHLSYQPSLAGASCDRAGCSGHLEERPDDRPEFLARRLSDFETLTAPVAACLEERAAGLVSVDAGCGSPEEVLERVLAGLKRTGRFGAAGQAGVFQSPASGQAAFAGTSPLVTAALSPARRP